MDPQDPTSFNHRTEQLSTGRTYHFVDQIPEGYKHGETPVLLLLHGFPDLWYGWRNQIGPWCRHGWRVVVPDMLGYGKSSKPFEAAEYSTKKISEDLAALLDLLSVDKAYVVGHDWGSVAAGKFCQWQTHRVRAVVMMSAATTPRPPTFIPIETLVQKQPDWGYMRFMIDDRSPSIIESNIGNFINLLFRTANKWDKSLTRPGGLESLLNKGEIAKGDLLSEKEFEYYLQNFREGGFRGPTNWYRAREPSWKDETEANLQQVLPASLPSLFLHPGSDPTSPQAAVDAMKPLFPGMKIIELENTSHWVMLERPEDVTKTVMMWLDEVIQRKGKL